MTHTHTHCIDILNVAGKGMPVCCNCVRISQLYSRRVCTRTGGEWKFGNSVVLNSFTKIVKIDPRYHSTAPILANVYRVRENIVYSSPFVKIYELILVEL